MMETILAFFATGMGKGTLISLGIYVLSLFSNSEWYAKARESVGRSGEAAGAAFSALGTSKLGFLWNPTEQVLSDFWFHFWEQFAVGLRKDNPAKIAAQIERLEDVGSKTRAAALTAKLELLATIPPTPRDKSDAEALAAIVASGDASRLNSLKAP